VFRPVASRRRVASRSLPPSLRPFRPAGARSCPARGTWPPGRTGSRRKAGSMAGGAGARAALARPPGWRTPLA